MAAGFDRVARLYRYLEAGMFGPALWRRRVAYLRELGGARRVLMLGEGDGRFLAAFVRSNGAARVDYADGSQRMRELAERRVAACGASGRVRYLVGDLTGGDLLAGAGGAYDAVVTHFFLDCLSPAELDVLVERVAGRAAPGAWWIVSEFQDTGLAAALVVRMLYAFFGVTAGLRARHLPGHRAALRRAGFVLRREEEAWRGLLVSELWQRAEMGQRAALSEHAALSERAAL